MSKPLSAEQLAEIRDELAEYANGVDVPAWDLAASAEMLLAEVDSLRRWKAEATPVMLGLQDLGRALGLPLGENITGPAALAEVERLRARVAELELTASVGP